MCQGLEFGKALCIVQERGRIGWATVSEEGKVKRIVLQVLSLDIFILAGVVSNENVFQIYSEKSVISWEGKRRKESRRTLK